MKSGVQVPETSLCADDLLLIPGPQENQMVDELDSQGGEVGNDALK